MGEPVYEMLWDCRYCGEKKLLGLTHRHCARCGAAQSPEARYFPAEDEKVAVADHRYVGADVVCRYCGCASSKQAQSCGRCGGRLVEGAPAPLQAPQRAAEPSPHRAPPRLTWRLILPVSLLVAVGAAVVLLLVWKKEQGFVVSAHHWQRSISVERLGPVRESAWCSDLPRDARDVERRRERRGTERVADGEDCRAQKQDLGDGTFKEVSVCSPRFKDEPVYADKCDYVVQKWHAERQAKAEGNAREPAPYWPSVAHSSPSEREGPRRETYTVLFQDPAGETYRCDLPESAWSSFSPGAAYRGRVRAVGGSIDCASLAPR
jgi:ribosomal protein L40E